MSGTHLAPSPELLLPAGSPEKLRYAIAYGADAVYLGLPMASLRTPSRGEQFTPQNLETWVRYAQQRGVKAYVTLNIFANNRDLNRVVPHLEHLEQIRPDALIISDPGIFRLARRHAPSVSVHLSTQANTLNVEACAFWQDLGVERVILAREVPVQDIADIHRALPDLELECFVHGSLCVAYSGRCVISDYLTDNTKNSNKGMCGNSCRWEFGESGQQTGCGGSGDHDDSPALGVLPAHDAMPTVSSSAVMAPYGDGEGLLSLSMSEVTRPNEVYTFEEDDKGTYMLNSRDLCLVRHIRRLQEAGVVSLKVEGRTKSVYYVATVGRIYREAIAHFQQHATASDEQVARWTAELSAAGNRGFTEGFLEGRPNRLAYNYADSRSHQTTRFLATTLEETADAVAADRDGRIGFKARNPFVQGDVVDWVTPQGVVRLTLDHMVNRAGLPVREVQTNHEVWLPVPDALQGSDRLMWSILRSEERVSVVS